MNDYVFVNSKVECSLKCLIDTGSTISTINARAWEKLGKPVIKTSRVGSILLGDNS